jgi:hypothetical protein
MPPIVIAFHYKNLDAMGGMICGYAGAKREPISDGRHNTRYRAAALEGKNVFNNTLPSRIRPAYRGKLLASHRS